MAVYFVKFKNFAYQVLHPWDKEAWAPQDSKIKKYGVYFLIWMTCLGTIPTLSLCFDGAKYFWNRHKVKKIDNKTSIPVTRTPIKKTTIQPPPTPHSESILTVNKINDVIQEKPQETYLDQLKKKKESANEYLEKLKINFIEFQIDPESEGVTESDREDMIDFCNQLINDLDFMDIEQVEEILLRKNNEDVLENTILWFVRNKEKKALDLFDKIYSTALRWRGTNLVSRHGEIRDQMVLLMLNFSDNPWNANKLFHNLTMKQMDELLLLLDKPFLHLLQEKQVKSIERKNNPSINPIIIEKPKVEEWVTDVRKTIRTLSRKGNTLYINRSIVKQDWEKIQSFCQQTLEKLQNEQLKGKCDPVVKNELIGIAHSVTLLLKETR